jgi:hypoxanthine-guanine phosphoribosyltransferase
VSEADPLLDRAAIQDAFRRLGERLARRDGVADIYVIGGAAMTLATYLVKHLGRTSTADALAVCMAVFPDEPVPDRSRLILDDLFDGG